MNNAGVIVRILGRAPRLSLFRLVRERYQQANVEKPPRPGKWSAQEHAWPPCHDSAGNVCCHGWT